MLLPDVYGRVRFGAWKAKAIGGPAHEVMVPLQAVAAQCVAWFCYLGSILAKLGFHRRPSHVMFPHPCLSKLLQANAALLEGGHLPRATTGWMLNILVGIQCFTATLLCHEFVRLQLARYAILIGGATLKR